MRIFGFILILLFLTPLGFAQRLIATDDPEALTDLRPAKGNKDISEAWLVRQTTRYSHFVLGSNYEAGGFRVRMNDGRIITFLLDEAHVFEDRQMRLADLDGDGRDEIILILSSLKKGASLAAYSVENGEVKLKAKTPFIGQPYRWLNPAGIADFNGDGALDVAFVAMPHLVKRLEFWTLSDGEFRQIGKMGDISNHRSGSVFTGMSAIADFDGDGIDDLAIPDGTRRAIRIISFINDAPQETTRFTLPTPADGTRRAVRVISFINNAPREIKRFTLPSPADGAFELDRQDNNVVINVPMENGDNVEFLSPLIDGNAN